MQKEALKWTIFVSMLIFLQLGYIYIFFVEPNWIMVTHVKIADPQLAQALSGKRFVQISDLHIQDFGYREVSLIEKINSLKADIIVVTGDMVEGREGITALWNFLSLLKAKSHIYAIYGDSDGAIADLKESLEWAKAGVSILEERPMRLNLKDKPDSAFWLAGACGGDLSQITASIPIGEPVILLAHRPDIIKKAALAKIKMVMVGHTHGGQVGFPLLVEFFSYAHRSNYISGLYRIKNTFLYVNRGIGSKK